MSDHHQHSPLINKFDTGMSSRAFRQSEAIPQVLSKAKNKMVTLPGQPSYNTKIPVCLWFGEKWKRTRERRCHLQN
jgi:hypothetical protein